MGPQMTAAVIENALALLGEAVVYHTDIELLIVGGAAGMITGLFPSTRTTSDCDVMLYMPAEAMVAVEVAAEEIAVQLGLSRDWLNSNVQLRLDALPDDWIRRRVLIGHWGRLRIFAASRVDLIAMKILAGRGRDIDDLRSLQLRSDDLPFLNNYLEKLPEKGTRPPEVAAAIELLAAWGRNIRD